MEHEVDVVVVCEVDHQGEVDEVVLEVVDVVDSVIVVDVVVEDEVDLSQEEHHEELPEVVVEVGSEVDVEDIRFCFLGRCIICLTFHDKDTLESISERVVFRVIRT